MTLVIEDLQWEQLEATIGPLRLPRAYCPTEPNVKQDWFLRRDELEVFFGGAAGPGKSWGLLQSALQYVDVLGYHALLLRPTLTEFEQPGGLIEVSHDWLDQTDAWWHGSERRWRFPSGASISFGYLANRADLRQYKGGGYSFCGFDELTGFTEGLYRAMFRVLRQAAVGPLEHVPLRMRSASNPGDIGHTWVKARFINPASRADGAVFVPATIHDNPHLDYVNYLKSLAHLDPVDRERLIRGDWDVMEEGGKFKREKFRVVMPHEVLPAVKDVRYWDLAATEPSQANPDPDWTIGLRLQLDREGTFTVVNIVAGRWNDTRVEREVRQTAEVDGRGIPVYIEKDPGQAGKAQLSNYARRVLQGYPCRAGSTRINGVNAAKEVRSRAVAAAVGNDLVQIVEGPNLILFFDQVTMFPNAGTHDDCVDALSGAYNAITAGGGTGRGSSSVPRGRIGDVQARPLPGRSAPLR